MKTVLRFIACSDLHFKADSPAEPARFEKGMRLAYAYAEAEEYRGIDAVYINGDFANNGLPEEMALMQETAARCVRSETEIVYTLASHEFMAPDGEAGAVSRFVSLFGQAPDCHKNIGGFHFISVTTKRGCHLGEKKLSWLRAELEKAACDYPKPIFVFQHPHPTDTVYGSIIWGEDEFIPVLMDYPGVIDFSGHSHAPINDPRSVHQKYFNSVGTGSLSYTELDEFDKLHGTVPENAHDFAQFVIVEARDDGSVLLRPFDIISGAFFGCDRLIEKPWEPDSFVYTDDRYNTQNRPAFKTGDRISVERRDGELLFTFPQAYCGEERSDSYTLRLTDCDTGRIVRQINVTSSYYLADMPETVTIRCPLPQNGRYLASVSANSFWGKVSEPITTEIEVIR